jgi:hypothetical protein
LAKQVSTTDYLALVAGQLLHRSLHVHNIIATLDSTRWRREVTSQAIDQTASLRVRAGRAKS